MTLVAEGEDRNSVETNRPKHIYLAHATSIMNDFMWREKTHKNGEVVGKTQHEQAKRQPTGRKWTNKSTRYIRVEVQQAIEYPESLVERDGVVDSREQNPSRKK